MIVRGRELHCRQGWGQDRWDMAADDVVLDVRVRRPDGLGGFGPPATFNGPQRRVMGQTAESIITSWSAERPAEAGTE